MSKFYFINTKIKKDYKINSKLNLKIITNDDNFYGLLPNILTNLNISILNLIKEINLQIENFIENIPINIKFILYENTKYIFNIQGVSLQFLLNGCFYFKIKKFILNLNKIFKNILEIKNSKLKKIKIKKYIKKLKKLNIYLFNPYNFFFFVIYY